MATNYSPIGDKLTGDLINEILLRLPLKSLLRSKLVSKTWLSLISDPSFIKSRFLRTLSASKSDQTLIVHSLSFCQQTENDTSISLLRPASRRLVADLMYPCSRGEFSSVQDCTLVGSARGIVCICFAVSDLPATYNCICSPLAGGQTKTYIWNPVTKQSKLIPPGSLRQDDDGMYSVALGFGYDPIDDDFKVVRVLSQPFRAEIYSVKRNVWNKVENPIDLPYDDDFDVCVNGFLCCTGMYGMMAFDLNKEVLNCAIKFPVSTFNARIIQVNDSVGVVLANVMESKSKIRLWTLDDEACLGGGGVEASWTLMFSIDVGLSVHFVHGYFNGGDLLVLADGVWYLYNKDKKETKTVPVLMDMRQVYKYTESLFSIDGSKQIIWNAHEDDN